MLGSILTIALHGFVVREGDVRLVTLPPKGLQVNHKICHEIFAFKVAPGGGGAKRTINWVTLVAMSGKKL